ncbi:tRNA-binding protein [Rubrivirga sp. IMCC45206]|uniref:tRNA-binding protein n=1 Tax=Rubrivirga sp. IMCC45206 TaxID=3391614 RepID=UPI00398FA547
MDFTTVDLRVGTVAEAAMEGEALRLSIDVGGVRQPALAHIGENYGPDDLVGRQVVVVPGDGGVVVLAAVNAQDGAVLLRPDRPVASGTRVV